MSNLSVLPLWIGGRALAAHARESAPVFDPALGRPVRAVPLCAGEDVDVAVQAAARAFPAWAQTPALKRARVLMRYRELLEAQRDGLARLIVEEHGKTLDDAHGSLTRGIEVVEFATGIPAQLKGEFAENVGSGVDCTALRQPLGVCVGITPFNFPAMVPLWMFPVAIACGNTFILKPSEKVPSTALRLAELAHQAGLPPGVLNVVHGAAACVDALLTHPQVAAISFVGSTPVAQHVFDTGTRAGKRVQALGGAKNHALVLPDADLDYTADALLGAAYGSAGERCMAISAVVAVGCGDALVARLRDKAAQIVVGPGVGTGVGMGPLVTRAHWERVSGYVARGVAEGATLALDGRGVQVAGHEEGFFLGPTLFDHVRPDMSIYRDEIFGPVLVVLRAGSFEEGLALINANPYGNGTAVFTRDGGAARRFQNEVQVGMVGINVPIPVPMAFFSFGGWKASLFGDHHMHGPEGVRFYTRAKVITTRWPEGSAPAPGLAMPTLG